MSYQYPYIEHYSPSPANSTPQAFHVWDLQEEQSTNSPQQPQQPQSQLEHQMLPQDQGQQHTPQSQPPQQQFPPPDTSPVSFEHPPIIQLQERPRRRRQVTTQALVPTDVRCDVDSNAASTPSTSELRISAPAASGDVSGPLRNRGTSRTQVRFSQHPYRRPTGHSASATQPGSGGTSTPNPTSVTGSPEDKKPKRDFDQGSSHSNASPVYTTIACPPTNIRGRQGESRSAVNSPSASPSGLASVVAIPSIGGRSQRRRFMIRTDVHYSPDTNVITVALELPGVKRADLSVALRVCPDSGAKQIFISGKSASSFPEESYTLRERKYGEFHRTLVVPSQTTPNDVLASMEDGILTLRIPGGPRSQTEEVLAPIAIN